MKGRDLINPTKEEQTLSIKKFELDLTIELHKELTKKCNEILIEIQRLTDEVREMEFKINNKTNS